MSHGKNYLFRYFVYDHVKDEHGRSIGRVLYEAANVMDVGLPECPEKSAGMRKLLEARDCFMRAASEAGAER